MSAGELSWRGRGVNRGSFGGGAAGNDEALGDIGRGAGTRSIGASLGMIRRTAIGAVIGSSAVALGRGVNGLGVNGAGVNRAAVPASPESGAGNTEGEPPAGAADASTASAANVSAISRADWNRASRSRENARAKYASTAGERLG